MSVASLAADCAYPCVIIVDRSASVIEVIAGRLGNGNVRIIAFRTALEALRHIQLDAVISVLIHSGRGPTALAPGLPQPPYHAVFT